MQWQDDPTTVLVTCETPGCEHSFFLIPGREDPTHCPDCAEYRKRTGADEYGWVTVLGKAPHKVHYAKASRIPGRSVVLGCSGRSMHMVLPMGMLADQVLCSKCEHKYGRP